MKNNSMCPECGKPYIYTGDSDADVFLVGEEPWCTCRIKATSADEIDIVPVLVPLNARSIINRIREDAPENPYPESIFPATVEDYINLIPNDKNRTAISGLLGRMVWAKVYQSIMDSVELSIREAFEDIG